MEHLVLYDGVCGLCDRFVQFVLRWDKHNQFAFAPIQSQFAGELLSRYGKSNERLETIFVIPNYENHASAHVLEKSRAVIFVLWALGGFFRLSKLASPLPTRWLDALYGLVARNRYRVFGKAEVCPIPTPQHRKRFLAVE